MTNSIRTRKTYYVKFLERLKNKMGKKIISCPSCYQHLRIPIRPGKTLLISCSKCPTKFQIKFTSPLMELKTRLKDIFQRDPNVSWSENFSTSFKKIIFLVRYTKFKYYLLFFLMAVLIFINIFQTKTSSLKISPEHENSLELENSTTRPSQSTIPYYES